MVELVQVYCGYNVVEKEETRVLLRFLNEIQILSKAIGTMSFLFDDTEKDKELAIGIFNRQVLHKLEKVYRYYAKYFDIVFDDSDWGEENAEFSEGYRINKTIENNLSLICETVESWK